MPDFLKPISLVILQVINWGTCLLRWFRTSMRMETYNICDIPEEGSGPPLLDPRMASKGSVN